MTIAEVFLRRNGLIKAYLEVDDDELRFKHYNCFHTSSLQGGAVQASEEGRQAALTKREGECHTSI
jgi:hypothetical protein